MQPFFKFFIYMHILIWLEKFYCWEVSYISDLFTSVKFQSIFLKFFFFRCLDSLLPGMSVNIRGGMNEFSPFFMAMVNVRVFLKYSFPFFAFLLYF